MLTTMRIVIVVLQSLGRHGGAIYVVVGLREVNFPALRQLSTEKVVACGPYIL